LTKLKFNKLKVNWGLIILCLAIALGIGFRFLAIDRKLFWHDEVYTSMRAAGFTRAEIDRELFTSQQLISAPQLQKYQHLKITSSNIDTINSLITEDPQHPPLYFLMARYWSILFRNSSINAIAISRYLPVFLSLLGLPLIYRLTVELFQNFESNPHLINPQQVGLIATAFLALSPFDILFAQTARQYSLLTVEVIGTSYLLLRGLRIEGFGNWIFYGISVAIALYTHPFFGLTLIGHGGFILIAHRSQIKNLILAVTVAIALYLPWIIVLVTNFSRTTSTTNWANLRVGFDYLLKLWTLSFTALFFDLDFGFNNIDTYILRLPIIILIGLALYLIVRDCSNSNKWFIFTSIFIPFLLLLIPDLVLGGKRSAVSRYLISCFPAIQIAMAYLLGRMLNVCSFPSIIGRSILVVLCTGSIISNIVSANAQTWWSKDLSYYNSQVSDRLNAVSPAILISNIGDDFTNTGDLISLSYSLKADVKLLLLADNSTQKIAPDLIPELNKNANSIYVFRPSLQLFKLLKLQDPEDLIFPEGQLWKLNNLPDSFLPSQVPLP
jgi:uncharacterized membrane protein